MASLTRPDGPLQSSQYAKATAAERERRRMAAIAEAARRGRQANSPRCLACEHASLQRAFGGTARPYCAQHCVPVRARQASEQMGARAWSQWSEEGGWAKGDEDAGEDGMVHLLPVAPYSSPCGMRDMSTASVSCPLLPEIGVRQPGRQGA